MAYANRSKFYFFISNSDDFFSCLISLAKMSSTFNKMCLIKMTGVDILVLFLILEEKLSALHCWVWCGVSFGLARYGLYYVLVCQKIKQFNPKGKQSWIFIAGIDVKAEIPILWPPDAKSWLTGKDPDAGKDRRQEKKGTTEDEMVGWHHQLNGHKFEQVSGDGKGQGSLACCSPVGHKELDMTKWLNSNKCSLYTCFVDSFIFLS